MARSREDRAGSRYGSKDTKTPVKEDAHPAEPDTQEAGGAGDQVDKSVDAGAGRADAYKRMEKERRDLHGSHREQIRQMQARHEAEMSKMMENHAGTGSDVAEK